MNLEQVIQEASYRLGQIQELFKPRTKLTLLARKPENDEADFVLTGDDLSEAAKALIRRNGGTPADSVTVEMVLAKESP